MLNAIGIEGGIEVDSFEEADEEVVPGERPHRRAADDEPEFGHRVHHARPQCRYSRHDRSEVARSRGNKKRLAEKPPQAGDAKAWSYAAPAGHRRMLLCPAQ